MTVKTGASSPTAVGRRWSVWILLGAVIALTLPLIVAGHMRGRGAHDQLNYHEKVIRTFAAEWPAPVLRDYLSATTPAYHLVLAAGARGGFDSLTALRLMGLGFTVGLVALLGWSVSRRLGGRDAVAACLPFVCSLYVVQSGAWLLPDNAGWLGVLAVLLIALRGRFDAVTVIGGGAALAVLVVLRQSHLWAAAPLWMAAWVGVGGSGADRGAPLMTRGRLARSAIMLAATLPAFALVAWFVMLWGGLTPPRFQPQYQGPRGAPTPLIASPAAPAFFLAIFGVGSAFFAAHLAPALRTQWSKRRAWLVAAVAASLALALVPDTTYDAPNRSSGVWNAAKILPALGGRTSPIYLILAPLGGAALLAWSVLLPARARWIMLASIAGFVAAQAASLQLWQRYSEPYVLMLLALMAAEARTFVPSPGAAAPASTPAVEWHGGKGMRVAGPLALAAVLLGVSALEILRGKPATDRNITLDPATTIPAPGSEPGPR